MNNLNDGKTHKVVFSRGKLYLDGVQIGGDDIAPGKDIAFDFKTNVREVERVKEKDPSLLEINVHDSVANKDVGPGQK